MKEQTEIKIQIEGKEQNMVASHHHTQLFPPFLRGDQGVNNACGGGEHDEVFRYSFSDNRTIR